MPETRTIQSVIEGATLRLETGDVAGALKETQELLEREPDALAAWLLLGRILTQMQQLEEANTAITRALAIEPEDPSIHYQMGNLSFQRREYTTPRDSSGHKAQQHHARRYGDDQGLGLRSGSLGAR